VKSIRGMIRKHRSNELLHELLKGGKGPHSQEDEKDNCFCVKYLAHPKVVTSRVFDVQQQWFQRFANSPTQQKLNKQVLTAYKITTTNNTNLKYLPSNSNVFKKICWQTVESFNKNM